MDTGVNPTKQHAMKCPKLYGQECTCDGYHTFDELYDHRITLFIALCRLVEWQDMKRAEQASNVSTSRGVHYDERVWHSKKHSDGEICFGTGTQYVFGIGRKKGEQITYRIPIRRWDETDFAETLDNALEWDGHSSDDVLMRLKSLS